MKSEKAKVLHRVAGRPMIEYPVAMARALGSSRVICVLGHQADAVQTAVYNRFGAGSIEVAIQAEQRGTGHAIQRAAPALAGFTGTLLVVCGDTPLLRGETLHALLERHARSGAAVTILSTRVPDPSGYGRIVREANGRVRIVEERDATAEEKTIDEINSAIYAFDYPVLEQALGRLTHHNAQRELYLTDTPALIQDAGRRAEVECAEDWRELLGVNTPAQLAELERIYLARRGGLGSGPERA
jgi:bifunctional UDP-N-acetylglucosamine pyrophosphorylase/glucosamine-1-phosphate N-acetyltransferase